jgi:hypothetical protein
MTKKRSLIERPGFFVGTVGGRQRQKKEKDSEFNLLGGNIRKTAQRNRDDFMHLMPQFMDNPFSRISSAFVLARLKKKANTEEAGNMQEIKKMVLASHASKAEEEKKREEAELAREKRHEKYKTDRINLTAAASRKDDDDSYQKELDKEERAAKEKRSFKYYKAIMDNLDSAEDRKKFYQDPEGDHKMRSFDKRNLLQRIKGFGGIFSSNKPKLKTKLMGKNNE